MEGGTSNEETLASGYGEVDVTDPGDVLSKHFFHVTATGRVGGNITRVGRERLSEVWSGLSGCSGRPRRGFPPPPNCPL